MDLYICQTVRHLLISLVYASQNKDKSAKIIVNFEHQDLIPGTFNESALSLLFDDLEILYLSESKIISEINASNLFGANNIFSRNFYIGRSGVKFTHKELAKFLPKSENLFIFHERVFLSKIYKCHGSVTLFDDGLANYSYQKEKHLINMILRLLKFKHPVKYAYGEPNKIGRILLANGEVDDLPEVVRRKAKSFDFYGLMCKKENVELLSEFFRLSKAPEADLLILTQNLDGAGVYEKSVKLEIFEALIKRLLSLGVNKIALKTHPSEDVADYDILVKRYNLQLIASKIPFEVLSSYLPDSLKVLSLYSSSETLTLSNGSQVSIYNIMKEGWRGWPSAEVIFDKIHRLDIDAE